MVQFNEKSFTITVECGNNPIEDWLCTYDDIITILQTQDKDMLQKPYNLLELLRQMMPDIPTAKKMNKK